MGASRPFDRWFGVRCLLRRCPFRADPLGAHCRLARCHRRVVIHHSRASWWKTVAPMFSDATQRTFEQLAVSLEGTTSIDRPAVRLESTTLADCFASTEHGEQP